MTTGLMWLAIAAVPAMLLLGFVFGRPAADGTGRLTKPLELATSVVVVGLALALWLVYARGTSLEASALALLAGMTAGLFGDLIMAKALPTPNRLIFGILAFGIGHVLYIVGFTLTAGAVGLAAPLTLWWLWGGALVLAAALWRGMVYSPRTPPVLNVGSLLYAGLIALMAACGAALAAQNGRFLGAAVGGALFLVSDLILGAREFRGTHWRLINDVVWVTYILGQELIALTTLYALPLAL
ncbi:MAG: lysoplasmalogenase family protein [Anaerolineae bacterium]